MKQAIRLTLVALISFVSVFLNSITVTARVEGSMEPEQLIYAFSEAVNSGNTDAYIALFTDEIQKEMFENIYTCGKDNFFAEDNRVILSIEKADIPIPESERPEFDDAIAYRVKEKIHFKKVPERKTYKLLSGEQINDYILVLKEGKWSIFRVSEDASSKSAKAGLSTPIETFIYFTKSGNTSFYGNGTSGIYFDDYLKDVIPNEWIVSYFSSYPHYGYAGVLASKMYAWYNTVYPKWNYSPYYACMKDNSEDQNYLIFSYSNMQSQYRTMQDSIVSFISNRAIVKSSNNSIFDIHYHATSGGYHTGTMSASGCLSKAQAGDLYTTILHYYYDKSPYIGTTNNANVITY